MHRRSLRLYLESCAIDLIDDRVGGHRASGGGDGIYDRILGWLDSSPLASADRMTRRAA
ncbi:hypothetical protein [Actinoplanes regularis]|uniref:hypothetical protein n=1 Tax=Actinoplanes regularis TaxID=52697 RepID=UPI00255563B7|nr:hypothetical protein [Actinoplanes regularis]